MDAALVIMAAGMGSRYGGNKQVDGVGPAGEILMEYSIYDAVRAGFTKVVFIIKPGMEELMRGICGDRLEKMTTLSGKPLEVCYAVQDLTKVPDFYKVPPERTRPFGTGHAVMCAADVVNEPFAVINADDYYGVEPFKIMYDTITAFPEKGQAAMAGFYIGNTLSDSGFVSRGVCNTEDSTLKKIRERFKVSRQENGSITGEDENGMPLTFDEKTIVSMNLWGFTPWIFGELKRFFEEFVKGLDADDIKSECFLPSLVDQLIERGELTVNVRPTDDVWVGMTYKEDRQKVVEFLKERHANGTYPTTLR